MNITFSATSHCFSPRHHFCVLQRSCLMARKHVPMSSCCIFGVFRFLVINLHLPWDLLCSCKFFWLRERKQNQRYSLINRKGMRVANVTSEASIQYILSRRNFALNFAFNPRGSNFHRLGYEMCHFLRVLFWLKNKFLGLFYSL